MILGLCGFADLLRRNGADVGATELIDAARALTLTDLADRGAVHRSLALTIVWSSVDPALFDRLFDEWFSGADLNLPDSNDDESNSADEPDDEPAVALDAETIDAARIHADDAITVEDEDGPSDADGATGTERAPAGTSPPLAPENDGLAVTAPGELAEAPPLDEGADGEIQREAAVVALPDAPPDAELELARGALADAMERRRMLGLVSRPRKVVALSEPLSPEERVQLMRHVRRLDRRLDGAPSWRRSRHHAETIDLRRTMRRTVTTAGLPIELRYTGRRNSAALLVVLVDLSMSVRGTARLVLHLVHRMRSTLGSVRAFGFVDSCVPIDRGLRIADPTAAIERVLGMVDVDASSDPGQALRQWWARSHHLVTPESHVMILSDGRCNGRDPAFDVVDRMRRRAASTLWISPEPEGAWTLGRGEMADYARRVDAAVTVRSIDDLEALAPLRARGIIQAK